jgi:hypothetical protein
MSHSGSGVDRIVVRHRPLRAGGVSSFLVAAAILGFVLVVIGGSASSIRGENGVLTFIGSIRVGLIVVGILIVLLSITLFLTTNRFGSTAFSVSGIFVRLPLAGRRELEWSDVESIDVFSTPRNRFPVLINLRSQNADGSDEPVQRLKEKHREYAVR